LSEGFKEIATRADDRESSADERVGQWGNMARNAPMMALAATDPASPSQLLPGLMAGAF